RSADRPISQRFQCVDVGRDGKPVDAGPEPYLQYRPATEDERAGLKRLLEEDWIATTLGDIARTHAVSDLATPPFEATGDTTQARVTRVRKADEERLTTHIRYWDAKSAELKQKELQGKKGRGGITSGHASNRADELKARLDRRLAQLDQESDVSNRPPVV